MILTICHQHKYLVVVFFLFKSLNRLGNRLADASAALWNDVSGQGVDILYEGVSVDCQWALQKSSAGEGD